MPRRRWRIAFLLSLGVLVNFFDRVNLSVSQDALHASFGISLIAFGFLSSAYNWSYALLQIPSGVLLDRFGVRRVGRVSTFLWSMASFAASISTGVVGFFSARLLLGVGEAPTFPSNAKALGYWFPEAERSLATAITDAAAKFSTAIGVPILGVLLLHFGWRWSFAATGAISFLYFVLFSFTYFNPSDDKSLSPEEYEFMKRGGVQPEDAAHVEAMRAQAAADAAAGNKTSGASLGYLLRQPKVYGLGLGWGAYNYNFYMLLTWLPSYLAMSHHVDLLRSVMYTSVPWLFATATDLLVGGWLVDALILRGYDANRVRKTVMVIGMGLGLGILAAATAHSITAALVWISISLGGLSAAAPVAWTVPSLIAPRESVGRVGGIVNMCGQVGAISAPIITGYAAAITHKFSSAFVLATAILLLGIAGYIFLLRRIEPIPEPLAE